MSIWRMSRCCCCCSLKTGTQIFLFLDLIQIMLLEMLFVVSIARGLPKENYLSSVSVTFAFIGIKLITIAVAFDGVKKHRPSYLLPHISLNVLYLLSFFIIAISLLFITLTLSDKAIDMFLAYGNQYQNASMPVEKDYLHLEFKKKSGGLTVFSLVFVILYSYFFCVNCSYYKQMQEEDKGTHNGNNAVVYSATKNRPQWSGSAL